MRVHVVPIAFLALLPIACAGLDVRRSAIEEPGRVVAVLPVRGAASEADRDVLRSMIHAQLSVNNLAVLDTRWVDHVLAREGLLVDADHFAPSAERLREMAEVLGADGIVVGREFAFERLDLLVLYRRGLYGELTWYTKDGEPYWRASYTAERRGGIALESGQVLNALRDTVDASGSRELVRLAVDWMDTVFASLPELSLAGVPSHEHPTLGPVDVTPLSTGSGVHVQVAGSEGVLVRFDVEGGPSALPLVEVRSGEYVGTYVSALPDAPVQNKVQLHAMDRYGHAVETRGTVAMGEVE